MCVYVYACVCMRVCVCVYVCISVVCVCMCSVCGVCVVCVRSACAVSANMCVFVCVYMYEHVCFCMWSQNYWHNIISCLQAVAYFLKAYKSHTVHVTHQICCLEALVGALTGHEHIDILAKDVRGPLACLTHAWLSWHAEFSNSHFVGTL